MSENQHNAYIPILIAVVAVLGFVATLTQLKGAVANPLPKPFVESTTSAHGVEVSASNGAKIEIIPDTSPASAKVPAVHRPIVNKTNVPADALAAITDRTHQLEALVTKNDKDTNSWINLGAVREMVGDHEGALQAWQYVVAIEPGNITATFNLAALYADQLKQYPQAEKAYQKAIALNPHSSVGYRSLFEMYTNTSYKPTATAAEDILKKGIAAVPEATDLHILLARYYKQFGNATSAAIEFKAAADAATKAGQSDIAAQIQTEAQQ